MFSYLKRKADSVIKPVFNEVTRDTHLPITYDQFKRRVTRFGSARKLLAGKRKAFSLGSSHRRKHPRNTSSSSTMPRYARRRRRSYRRRRSRRPIRRRRRSRRKAGPLTTRAASRRTRVSRPKRIRLKQEIKKINGHFTQLPWLDASSNNVFFETISSTSNPKCWDLKPHAWTNTLHTSSGMSPIRGVAINERIGNKIASFRIQIRFCFTIRDTSFVPPTPSNISIDPTCLRFMVLKLMPRDGYDALDYRKFQWTDFFQDLDINSFRKDRRSMGAVPNYKVITDKRFTVNKNSVFTQKDFHIHIPPHIMNYGDNNGTSNVDYLSPQYVMFLVQSNNLVSTDSDIKLVAIDSPASFRYIDN